MIDEDIQEIRTIFYANADLKKEVASGFNPLRKYNAPTLLHWKDYYVPNSL